MALLKSKDVSINLEEPWENDPFGREQHGRRLYALISSLRDQPYVVALNGDWGTGKSVFLRRLEAHFEGSSQKLPVIRIDAWAADDAADPLVPFTAAIHRRLEKTKERGEKVRDALTKAAATLAVPTAQFFATLAAPGSAGGVGAAAKFGTALIDWELAREKSTNKFKKALEDARDLLTGRTKGGPIKAPIVIAIDELDRCRPDFSIRALERIKHFFNIAGVVFVIATDRGNLPAAVRSVYGASVDGELYLRKFFDFEYRLPPPPPSEYFGVLWRDYGLDLALPRSEDEGLISRAFSHPDKYQEVLSTNILALDAYEYRWYFVMFADYFQLSLRDQSQAFTMLAAHILTSQKMAKRFPILDALLVCLRFFSLKAFDEFSRHRLDLSSIHGEFEPNVKGGLNRVGALVDYKALSFYLNRSNVGDACMGIQGLINGSRQRNEFQPIPDMERILARAATIGLSGAEYVADFLGLVYAFAPDDRRSLNLANAHANRDDK